MKFPSAVLVISVVVAVAQVAAVPVSPPNDIDPFHAARDAIHLSKSIPRDTIHSTDNLVHHALDVSESILRDAIHSANNLVHHAAVPMLLPGLGGGGGCLPLVSGLSQPIVNILCGSGSPKDRENGNAGATIGCMLNAIETTRVFTEKLKQIRDSKSTDKVTQRTIEKLVSGASGWSKNLENMPRLSTSALAEIKDKTCRSVDHISNELDQAITTVRGLHHPTETEIKNVEATFSKISDDIRGLRKRLDAYAAGGSGGHDKKGGHKKEGGHKMEKRGAEGGRDEKEGRDDKKDGRKKKGGPEKGEEGDGGDLLGGLTGGLGGGILKMVPTSADFVCGMLQAMGVKTTKEKTKEKTKTAKTGDEGKKGDKDDGAAVPSMENHEGRDEH